MENRDEQLPVTGEVGSEGGSYAESTMQAATLADERGIGRTEGDGFSEPGLRRYASEEPPASGPGPGSRVPWRAGLIGAAAGAGAAVAAALLKRRR